MRKEEVGIHDSFLHSVKVQQSLLIFGHRGERKKDIVWKVQDIMVYQRLILGLKNIVHRTQVYILDNRCLRHKTSSRHFYT